MALSGRKTVTTAGTMVALGSQVVAAPVAIKALTTNTGLVYVGDGVTASAAAGYPLLAGDVVVLANLGNLANVYVDSAVNGEGVAWVILGA